MPRVSTRIGGTEDGRKTRAESDCKLIAMAVAGYKNDYHILPGIGGGYEISKDIYDRLGGRTGRKKVYFENTGKLLNSWDKPFFIAFDDDYDGKVYVPIAGEIEASVAVWTEVPGDTYVTSWE